MVAGLAPLIGGQVNTEDRTKRSWIHQTNSPYSRPLEIQTLNFSMNALAIQQNIVDDYSEPILSLLNIIKCRGEPQIYIWMCRSFIIEDWYYLIWLQV